MIRHSLQINDFILHIHNSTRIHLLLLLTQTSKDYEITTMVLFNADHLADWTTIIALAQTKDFYNKNERTHPFYSAHDSIV